MPLDGAYTNTQETFGIDPLLKGLENDPLFNPPSSGGYEPEDKLPQDSGFDKDLVSNPNFHLTGIKSDELGTSTTSISSGKVEASTVESDVDSLTKQPLKEEANPLPDEIDPLLNPRPSAAVEEEVPSVTTVDSEGVDEENDNSVDEPVGGDTDWETTSSVESDDENGVTDEGDEIADNNSLFVTNETDEATEEEAEVTTDDTVNSTDAIMTEERDEIVSGDSLSETTGESDMEAGDNTTSGTGETDEDAEVPTHVSANLETQTNEITATDETVSDGVVAEETTTGDTDDAANSQTEADEITATDETVSDGVVEEETTTENVDEEESDHTENAVTEERETSSELNPADDTAGEDNTVGETAEIADSGDEEIETDVTGETEDNAGEDATATDDAAEDSADVVLDEAIATPKINFDIGIFKVDASGKVSIDFLFDGGAFRSQVAIVSLSGMEGLDPNSVEFIREAATRAASNTELGYVVIDDVNEGAKFTGRSGEGNYNSGTYEGVKTFIMRPEDEFFLMLVPNGTVQQVIDNPTASGGIRPLFSIATANPDDAYHARQIADLTGDGSAFAWEDLRFDRGTDKDYNDIVLQIRGAKGKAALMDDVVAEGKDWRNTDMGQAVIEYVKAYITPDAPDFDSAISDLIGELEDLTAGEETDTETDSGEEAISNEGIEDAIADGNNPETEETGDEIADSEGEDPIASDEIEDAIASDDVVGDEVEDAIASDDNVAEEIDNSTTSDDSVADDTFNTDSNETVNQVSDTDTTPETEQVVTDSPEDSSSELVESSVEETDATTKAPSVTADSVIDESESVEDSTEKDASEINALVEEVETEVESATETGETTESSTQPVATKSADNSETDPLPATPEVASSDNSATLSTAVIETADNTASETQVVEITSANVESQSGDSDFVATNEEAIATGSETADNSAENAENTDAITPNTQPVTSINTQLIFRLETLTQTLKERGTDAIVSGGTSVTPALVERLETLTESLKNQNNSQPVSANTTALVSRLEEMVVRALPPAIVAPSSFEFPQKNQPLVGAINETGFTANNPNVDYSRITPLKDRVEGDDNPFVAADDSANSDKTPLEIIKEINKNAPLVVGRALGNSEDWAQSVIEYVDKAKASGQPNAILNLNLKLTEVNENGEVVPRYQLTPNQRAAIAYAQKNNIIIVVPAGDIPEEMSALGQLSTEFDNVITVGTAQRVKDAIAISKAYAPAENSGSGAALDIVADGGTGGTLEASAQVTGAMSQVWAANPKLNYTQVIDILKRTATDLSQPNWDATTGAGMVNAIAAVELAKATLPELYTVKPGARTITDNFISQPNADKELPGEPTHPAIQPPGIPQTDVDTGGNNIANATQLLPSATVDVIDQVSAIDPTDIYRVESRYLDNAEFSVLSGEVSVSYLTPSGQLLSTQVLTKGTHQLQLPANAPEEAIVQINRRGGNPATYVLAGFEPVIEESFNINLEFESPLTASQKQVMQAAAKNVAALIGKGLPSAVVDGKIIDDLNIKISTANIDGASGTQARTKIDFMRYGSLLPAQSLVQFDAADIAELEQSGQLFDVVQHEFLHALGFGNLWEAKGLVNYPGTPLAQYKGENAVEEFQKLGGLTNFVSLETEGDGSAGFHWHEMLFQNELMTADLNGNGSGGNAPISAVTLASLADLGYEVNLGGATSDYQLFGGEGFNPDELTPEQVEAFRELAETSFEASGEEYIAPIMPTVDPDKVSPEIWAHAEKFWKNGEYYDWVPYPVQWGDTLSQIALDTMGSAHPDYYWWIANHNGIPNPDYIVASDGTRKEWIDIPQHHPNYEWKQEQERLQREAELKQKQEEEAQKQKELEEKLKNDLAEQEKFKQEQERLQQEAQAKQKELEQQAQRLAEELEKKRQQEEFEKEQARLAELARQAEIARQQGKGGQEWYFAKPLPEFGPTDPFETKLTGETVGNLVPDDYYRFTLSRKGRIDARLMNLLADADLVLYDARNRPISYSMREGITDEQILVDLIPGTYMLRVNSPGGVTTDYDLIVKFKHLLSRTEQGPPPGWQVGGSAGGAGGGAGGGIPAGATFADPRIERIYKQAIEEFAAPLRRTLNQQVAELKSKRDKIEREQKALIASMSAELRQKVHANLDKVRDEKRSDIDKIANGIKRDIDWLVDRTWNNIKNLIPGAIRDFGPIKSGLDGIWQAIDGSKKWLKGKIDWVKDRIKDAIWWFIQKLKDAYLTGGEANINVEEFAKEFRNKIDEQVRNLNGLIGEFRGFVLSKLDFTKEIAVDWPWLGIKFNLYDSISGTVNNLTNGAKGLIEKFGGFFKDRTSDAEYLVQQAIGAIASLMGDETGRIYNKMRADMQEIDNQINSLTGKTENTIRAKASQYKFDLEQMLINLGGEGKKILNLILDFGNSPVGQLGILAIEVILGFVPGIGQAIDIKDTYVALDNIYVKGQKNVWEYINLLLALSGWVPGLGDLIKSVGKAALKGGSALVGILAKLGADTVESIIKAIRNTDWDKIAKNLFDTLGNKWDDIAGKIAGAPSWVFGKLRQGFDNVRKGVSQTIDNFKKSPVGQWLNEAVEELVELIKTSFVKLPKVLRGNPPFSKTDVKNFLKATEGETVGTWPPSHFFRDHVSSGNSSSDLANLNSQLVSKPNAKQVTMFKDEDTAAQAIAEFINFNYTNIENFATATTTPGKNKTFSFKTSLSDLGFGIDRAGKTIPTPLQEITVVVKGRGDGTWLIQSAFPK